MGLCRVVLLGASEGTTAIGPTIATGYGLCDRGAVFEYR
jgi:hypothetical protein